MKVLRWLMRYPVGPVRALLETLIVFTLLLDGMWQLELPGRIPLQGVFFLCMGCALLCAARLRPTAGRRDLLSEGTIAILLGSLFVTTIVVETQIVFPGIVLSDWHYSIFFFLLVAACGFGFVACRLGLRLWRFWNRMRREHLIWSLTHAHLLVVLAISSLFVGFVFTLTLMSTEAGRLVSSLISTPTAPAGSKIARFIISVLPTLSLATMFIAVLVVIVLPPSWIFSWLVMRRVTRRIQTVAAATKALRAKDYTVRVTVRGEDEIANLQGDFNAMADDLERAMRALRTERDTVAALLQTRRDLAANVSHELRTPVATLLASLESAIEHDSPPTIHDLEIMAQDVIRLRDLIDDLFALSRAEVGQLTLRCEPTHVSEVIRRVVDSTASLAWRSSRVEILAEIAPELPQADVDGGRLEQILRNLLQNSLRHTPSGGVITVAAAAEAESVCIDVWDTGEGIYPEDLPHIWERFYQSAKSQDHHYGAGLGLAVVKDLAEAMHGTVAVDSTPGAGSRFTLRFPRHKSIEPAGVSTP